MDVMVGEKVFSNAELGGVGTNPGQRSLHGLLHHLADLSRHGGSALAFHGIGFDEEHITAGGRPGQAHSNSGAFCALGDLAFDADLNPT